MDSTGPTMTTWAALGYLAAGWKPTRVNPPIGGYSHHRGAGYRYVMAQGTRVQRAVEAVERAGARTHTADELLEALAGVLHEVVPHDGATWFGIDPVTTLATAPSRVEGLDAGLCDTFWHLEFHEQDTALFADLARGERAAAMRLSLDDRLNRSVR